MSLESSLDLLLADGRLALDSLMLARTLQAGAGVAAASTDVLAVEILELLLIGSQTSQQVELLVPRQQSLSASGLADAQGPLSLTRGHGLNLDRVVTLAEIVSLSLAQGVDVVGLLSAGESTWLSESRGLGADSDGLWTATLELSRTHAIGGNELAALFLELQLERVNSTLIGVSAGLADLIGLSVYRSLSARALILVTHRFIFVVDADQRIFSIARETRTFSVTRGE